MINSIYQLLNKGSLRTLSFILAILITLAFFFNISQFSTNLRTVNPALILFIVWSVGVCWIHGLGFDIKNNIAKFLFMPIWGYMGALIAIYLSWLA